MKILIRGTNWIGDAVMAIPAMRHVRRMFPDAHIALLTRSWAEGIFRDADFIDEILPVDKMSSKIKDVFAQAKQIREKQFDLAILLPNSFESALVARIAGIRKRYGYAKDGRSLLLTNAVSVPEWKNERHEIYYYLNLAEAIAKDFPGTPKPGEPETDLNVSDERRLEARDLFISSGLDLQKPVVALGVGSTNSRAKRWPVENYAALNDRIQQELKANVILVGGGADEIEISQNVYDLSRIKPLVLTGKTDLAAAVAILSEADLLISNDMGLAHIAPSTGTETIVIFGPTNPATTRPAPGIASIMRRTDVNCSPCMLRDCPIDHRCMIWITPDAVFEKAAAALS